MTRLFFAIFLLTLAVSTSLAEANDFTTHYIATKRPLPVPSFSFQDGHNRTVDLHDFKGRYVLLNLWATWCGPCVREMPSLDRLQQKIDGKLSVLALNEDHDGLTAAQTFYRRHDLHHLSVFAESAGEAPSILHVSGLPTTLFIDPNGMEVGRIEGDVDWDDMETVRFLEKQMKRSLTATALTK